MSTCATEIVEPLRAERVLLPQSDESEDETNDTIRENEETSKNVPESSKPVPVGDTVSTVADDLPLNHQDSTPESTSDASKSTSEALCLPSPSILINGTNGKSSIRSPKRVSFEKRVDLKPDKSVLKFVCGEEIIDQENPFRQPDISDDETVPKYNIVGIPVVKAKPRLPVARSRNSLTRLSAEEIERFKSKYSNYDTVDQNSHSCDLDLKTKIEGKTVGKPVNVVVEENNNEKQITNLKDDSVVEYATQEVIEKQSIYDNIVQVEDVNKNGDIVHNSEDNSDSNMSDKSKKRASGIRKIFPVSLFSKTRSPNENGKPDSNWSDRNVSKSKPVRRIILEPPKDMNDIKVVRRFGSIDVPRQPSMNLEDQVERMQRELEIVSNDKTSNLYSGPNFNRESKQLPKTKIPNSSSSSSSTLISDSSDSKPQIKQISRLKRPSTDTPSRVNNSNVTNSSGRNSAPILSPTNRTMQISRLPKLNSSPIDKRTDSPLNFLDTKSRATPSRLARPVAMPNPDKIANENKSHINDTIKSKPVPAARNFDKRATSFNVNHKVGYQTNRNVTDDSKVFEGVSAEMKITKAPVVYNTSKLRTRSLSPRQRHKLDGSKVPSSGMQMLPDKEFGDQVQKDVGDYAKLKNVTVGNETIKSPQACSTPERNDTKVTGPNIVKPRKILSPIPAPILPPREVQKVQTRQNVEAFCWKKLQEMNRRNEEQIYANCFDRFNGARSMTPPVVPPHAIDPIYGSRSDIVNKAQPQVNSGRVKQIIPAPIFKRGSLVSEIDLGPVTPNGGKRVSFSGGSISPRLPLCPPPVRRVVTVNDKVCDVYGRIHELPKGQDDYIRNPSLRRPLPPVPIRAACDSESGSEAGEVQRIMQPSIYQDQRLPNGKSSLNYYLLIKLVMHKTIYEIIEQLYKQMWS